MPPGRISGIAHAYNADGSAVESHPLFRPHLMQGWAPDFIPKLTRDALQAAHVDEVVGVNGNDALRLARALATEEGILAGISGGATLAGAIETARRIPKGSTVLCMIPDTGERYLSTPLFDGRSLDGWQRFGGKDPDAWGVEGGRIVSFGEGGGWIGTDGDFDDFELRLQFRIVEPGANSGIYLRAPADASHISRTGMEIRVLLEELTARAPKVRALGPADRLRSNFIGGIKHLPVELAR